MKHKWLWSPEVFPTENEIKEKSNKTKFSPFFKSSRSQALYKKFILKNLAKSRENWCCLSLFFDKVTGLEALLEHLFTEHLGWLLLFFERWYLAEYQCFTPVSNISMYHSSNRCCSNMQNSFFNFCWNENHSTIDSCFHTCTTTSIDDWVSFHSCHWNSLPLPFNNIFLMKVFKWIASSHF